MKGTTSIPDVDSFERAIEGDLVRHDAVSAGHVANHVEELPLTNN